MRGRATIKSLSELRCSLSLTFSLIRFTKTIEMLHHVHMHICPNRAGFFSFSMEKEAFRFVLLPYVDLGLTVPMY